MLGVCVGGYRSHAPSLQPYVWLYVRPYVLQVKDGMLVALLRHDQRVLTDGALPPQVEDMDELAEYAELEAATT